jgi:hypothetical protein
MGRKKPDKTKNEILSRDAISTEMMGMVKVELPREKKQPFNFECREFHHRAAASNN